MTSLEETEKISGNNKDRNKNNMDKYQGIGNTDSR
jgi:hypothetical protein